jgi:superfamily II DNA/RNA helicase
LNQKDLSRGSDIIISTPGRTNDLINRGMLDMSEIQCIVLDEADRMLDMGFKDDIYKIIQAVPKKNMENLQFIMFSATIND